VHSSTGDLLDKLSDQTKLGPDRLAVASHDCEISYGDLDRLSDRVADALRTAGCRPGERVGLRLNRSTNLIVQVVGAWKARLCYVPLDQAYPSQRTEQIIGLARPSAVVDEDGIRLTRSNDDEESSETGYLIFTSGSTGRPKGVPVTEKMVGALMAAALPKFDFVPADRWGLMHSYNFDFSVWEIWGALTSGASLHVPSQATLQSPHATIEFLRDAGITILNQVPSVFTQLAQSLEDENETLPDLRHVIFGGEDVRRADIAVWRSTGSSAALTNMYGITEITVHATYRRLEPFDEVGQPSSIGRPLPGFDHRIVDADLTEVPSGEIGELLLSGPQVATGYFRDPEQTRARMIRVADRLWYRTGDLVMETSGELAYVGRADGQVQLRGFRVETGEVERVIARSGLVRQQAVCAVERPGGVQLVAVVAVAAAELDVPDRLREFLRAQLPSYMVPARIVQVDRLPMTPSGKLDTRELANVGATP